LTVLGDAYLEVGDPRRAMKLYERHRGLLRHENEDKSYLLSCMVVACLLLSEREQALTFLRESVEVFSRFPSPRAETVDALVRAYLELGEPRRALELSQSALEVARKKGDARAEAMALCGIARAHVQLDESRLALDRLPRALELMPRLHDRRLNSLVHEQLGLAHEKLGEMAQAATALEVRMEYLQSIGHVSADLFNSQPDVEAVPAAAAGETKATG
jgi:tetratricopeptide (TPR) repeat protein